MGESRRVGSRWPGLKQMDAAPVRSNVQAAQASQHKTVHTCMHGYAAHTTCVHACMHVCIHALCVSLLLLPQVKDLWKHLAAKTVGVARVDLRRPT